MDKAKAAINDFMSKSGHHDTTVHEAVAPAVQHEVIKPHQHEEVLTAVDKEVHQDHYHRTVQPIVDREVLPEQHIAKLGAVQHREFDHRDAEATKRALIAEQQLFKDERRVDQTTYSQSAAATVGGEHIHHHIHETIQPVIQREVIQPEVIHTTVPIHEVHHNKATLHEVTALPVMTMDQFKAKGGSLTGREERYDAFEGIPKNIGAGAVGGFGAVPGDHKRDSHNVSSALKSEAAHGDYHGKPNAFHGDLDSATAQRGNFSDPKTGQVGADGPVGSHTGTGLAGGALGAGAVGAGLTGKHHKRSDSSSSSDSDRRRSHGNTRIGTDGPIGQNTGTGKKPSLMDKLNPKVDSNGDGKRGFMA